MIQITFPEHAVTTRQRSGIDEIFDPVRKKWLQLTPEEWVRQHIISYLLKEKNYPASLLAVEKEISVGKLKKRCDIVVYRRDIKPMMIIECKEMDTPLTSKVLEQVLRYHITLQADYLIITNGLHCYGFQKTENQFKEIDQFPDYNEP